MPAPISFSAIRALTFDCYGTLVDWETGLLRDLRAGLESSLNITDEQLLSWYAMAESEAETGPFRKYKEVLRRALEGVARLAKVNVRDPFAIVNGLPSWPVFPDSPAALAILKKQYKLCITSNVDRDLFLLTQKNLGVEFDEIVTADQIESYKPRPNHLWEALRLLKIQKTELLHVAQSLFHDHAPARALGIRSVWIDRRGARAGGATPSVNLPFDPDLRVGTLEEFAQIATRR
ncbi:MAG: haloacid dehalogenase type II [Planctomycetota bacterium]